MTIGSTEIYQALQTAFAEANEKIQIITGGGASFTIWAGHRFGAADEVRFTICDDHYSSEDIKVDGRDFWDCVDEFIRRKGFAVTQKNLQLGAPVIEQELPDEEI